MRLMVLSTRQLALYLLNIKLYSIYIGAVEACLRYKLKKQTVGLFGNSSGTVALLQKVAKHLEEAKNITKELDQQTETFSR